VLPPAGPFGRFAGGEPERVGTRAVNRWLADFVSHRPERHAAAISLPLGSPMEQVVDELQWGREHGLRGGACLYSSPELRSLPLYSAAYYDPMWSACEELGLPVLVHADAGFLPPRRGGLAIWRSELEWWNIRPLRCFIFGEVFERHPALRVVFVETGCSWVPEELRKLDAVFAGRKEGGAGITRQDAALYGNADAAVLRDGLTKTPSEYFASNVSVPCGADASEWAVRKEIGVDNLIWGSDYPHNESSWPTSAAQLQRTVTELSVPTDDVRKIIGQNAAKLWDFDLDALEPIAASVGREF
jgi:predicted TIM-barrel fold metal-dependent hydrolase